MQIEILIFLLIFSLTVILTYYNHRQARAIEAMRDLAEDMVSMQIRDRRTRYQADAQAIITDDWIAAQVEGVLERKSPIASYQIIHDVHALDVTLQDGRKVLITTTAETELKRRDQRARGSRLADFANRPVLPRRYKIVSRTLIDNEFLDIEAETIASRLGLEWRSPARLWFYVTG